MLPYSYKLGAKITLFPQSAKLLIEKLQFVGTNVMILFEIKSFQMELFQIE